MIQIVYLLFLFNDVDVYYHMYLLCQKYFIDFLCNGYTWPSLKYLFYYYFLSEFFQKPMKHFYEMLLSKNLTHAYLTRFLRLWHPYVSLAQVYRQTS